MGRHSQHDGGTIRGTWTSSIQRCFSVGSWNLEEEQQGDHTPPCGCFEHRDFVLHSANQLCVYGAVARWCEDFGMKSDETPPKTSNDKILKEVRPEEVTSLVEAPRNAQPAAGNSLRGFQQNFEILVTAVQFTRFFSRNGIHPCSCCRKILQNSLICG